MAQRHKRYAAFAISAMRVRQRDVRRAADVDECAMQECYDYRF